MKTKRKISPLRISLFFCLKLGEDQNKKVFSKFSPVFGPKLGEEQKKKIFVQILFFSVLKLSTQVTKGSTCRNFAYYFMLIILSWRTKVGGHGTMPLPPKYAPVSSILLMYSHLPKCFTRNSAQSSGYPCDAKIMLQAKSLMLFFVSVS